MTDLAQDILARTIWGEARGEGTQGMTAVACVVINRLAIAREHSEGYWWGNTVPQICQSSKQFSCWNADDPNRAKLLGIAASDPQFTEALQIAADAIAGKIADVTKGATHYVAAGINPAWLREDPVPRSTARIGRHVFYQLVPVPMPVGASTPTPTPTEKETLNV